jgi:hypothetical protein
MNPLSDWFVDAESVAERQQRLLDSVGYTQRPFGGTGTTSSSRAPRRPSCLNRLWNSCRRWPRPGGASPGNVAGEDIEMKASYRATLVATLVVLMAGSGCAGPSGSLAPDASALPADTGRSLVGVWRGTISGSELQTGSGPVTIPATLTVKDDQTWTLAAGSLRVVSRNTSMNGGLLVLDGRITAGGTIGRPVTMILSPPRDGALHGGVDIYYAGRPVSAAINLQSVPQAP